MGALSKVVAVFGKTNCPKCESTKRKIHHLLTKRGLSEEVSLLFHDLDTPDGLTEAAFVDVATIPTTIVNVDGTDCGRWEGQVPKSVDILAALNQEN